MKNNKEILSDILAHLDNLSHIRLDKIPEIDLYMDQVTTFMDRRPSDQDQKESGRQGTDQDHDQQLCQEPPSSSPGQEEVFPAAHLASALYLLLQEPIVLQRY